ncbi:MAG TPA: hypothetical protein VF754_08065 [Pyrinomonadaceae bacterium]
MHLEVVDGLADVMVDGLDDGRRVMRCRAAVLGCGGGVTGGLRAVFGGLGRCVRVVE